MSGRVRIAVVLCLLAGWCIQAHGMWMTPEKDVPVGRLIENLKAFVEKNPDKPEGYFALGRVYSFAYGTGATLFDAYDDDGLWDLAIYGRRIPDSSPANAGQVSPELLDYLAQSIKYYQLSLEKKTDDEVCWLGLGYDYQQAAAHCEQISWPFAVTPFDAEAKSHEKDKRFWEDKALEAYRKSFALGGDKGGGLSLPIGVEAGDGILSILQKRQDLSEAERKEVRRVKRAVSSMRAKDMRAITPIIFSLENRSFEQLLDSRKKVAFDLDGSGRKGRWEWVSPKTCFLAWDPDGTGRIASGCQLFGSATWWMFWRNGYAALAALDNDGNGWLEGTELKGIVVWQDRNVNGRSDAGEVVPLAAVGIAGIQVSSTGAVRGTLCSQNGIRFADGHMTTTFDWVSNGSLSR